MLRNTNPYSSVFRGMRSQAKNIAKITSNTPSASSSKQLATHGTFTAKSKAPWQNWVDNPDIFAMNNSAPKDTRYDAVPVDEATGNYANTKISNTKTQLDAFNTLKSINGKAIKELRAENNVLKFEAGTHYRFSIGGGQSVIVSSALSQTGTGANISWEDVAAEFGTDMGVFTTGIHRTFALIQLFMPALTAGDTWNFERWTTPSERLDLYAQVGIQPGDWVEIQNQNQTSRFYLDNNGVQWSEAHSEDARWSMNNTDWSQQGATADTIFLVNGKEYKIDDSGHLNIPQGEPVIYGETVVFPKEIGKFLTQKSSDPPAHLDQQA